MRNTSNIKRAVIISRPDAYANSVKPRELKKFLDKNNIDTTQYSTTNLTRLGDGRLSHLFPGLRIRQLHAYLYEGLLIFALNMNNSSLKGKIITNAFEKLIRLRGRLIFDQLASKNYDLLICEDSFDEGIFLQPRISKIQILDLPAPQAEELYYGGSVKNTGFKKLQKLEKIIYANTDYLSFHWHTYAQFVKDKKYSGKNFIDLGYGTKLKKKHAYYSTSPRIIFLGYLEGYWVNIPLLEKLCQLYPNIDVFGGPPPPVGSKINYKGYAPSLEILANYQFGLVTISKDALRRSSFSSKHLEYISYGLPVLTPDWRHDSVLDDSSIHYNVDNFMTKLERYNSKEEWQKKSQAALKTARLTSWENALRPLENIMNGNT